MSRWKEFRREPVAGNGPGSRNGLSPGTVAVVVLGMPSVPSALGDPVHGRRRGCGKLTYHHKQRCARSNVNSAFRVGVLPGPDGRRHGVLHIFWAWRVPDGERAPPVLDLSRMALVTMASPPWRSGRLDQGLSAQSSFPEPSQPVRHQPVRPGSMRLREYVLVLETIPQAFLSVDCGKRCSINGPPGMPIAGLGARSKSLGSCSSRPGRICCQGILFCFSGTILQLYWERVSSIRRCDHDLASMRSQTVNSFWSSLLRTGSDHPRSCAESLALS